MATGLTTVMAKGTHSATNAIATRLRTHILSAPDGAFLGNEESLQSSLGASRTTVRQVARILEREGLLAVRRGINGGYYGTRPNADTIEGIVSSYLEVLKVAPDDLMRIAAALWVEVVSKAAALGAKDVDTAARIYRNEITAFSEATPFDNIRDLEQAFRTDLFSMTDSPYIELIFHFNTAFARRRFPVRPSTLDGSDAHRAFVDAWRRAKILELGAIIDGDVELAAMAARRSRSIWHERVAHVA